MATWAISLALSAPAHGEDGRYIVRLAPGQALTDPNGSSLPGVEQIRTLSRPGLTVARLSDSARAELLASGTVLSIEPDPPRHLLGEVTPYGITEIEAHLLTDGDAANRTVCIVDSGYDVGHPDLNENRDPAAIPARITGSSVGEAGDWREDGCGHGSHVAGTIAALANTEGVRGVLPGGHLKLHIVRIFDQSCESAFASDVIDALQDCAAAGAHVVNLSLGCDGAGCASPAEQQAFDDAFDQGILSVAAAGNEGDTSFSYPASYASVMSVAAIDESRELASFSQRNAQVEISGPGVNVLSTVPLGTGFVESVEVGGQTYGGIAMQGTALGTGTGPLVDCALGDVTCPGEGGHVCLIERGTFTFAEKTESCEESGGVAAVIYNNVEGQVNGTLGEFVASIPSIGITRVDGLFMLENHLGDSTTVVTEPGDYAFNNGTSMATPHVAGAAALIWSRNTDWTNTQIRNALTTTALDLGEPGRDDSYGYGLVRARLALLYLAGQNVGPVPVLPPVEGAPDWYLWRELFFRGGQSSPADSVTEDLTDE